MDRASRLDAIGFQWDIRGAPKEGGEQPAVAVAAAAAAAAAIPIPAPAAMPDADLKLPAKPDEPSLEEATQQAMV